LTELGKGVFTIKLGKLTLDSEVIIAEIEDDALLGLDILMKGGGHHNRMCLNKIRMRFYQEILWLSKIISFKSINKYINNHFS
jgi:hypothetical protein